MKCKAFLKHLLISGLVIVLLPTSGFAQSGKLSDQEIKDILEDRFLLTSTELELNRISKNFESALKKTFDLMETIRLVSKKSVEREYGLNKSREQAIEIKLHLESGNNALKTLSPPKLRRPSSMKVIELQLEEMKKTQVLAENAFKQSFSLLQRVESGDKLDISLLSKKNLELAKSMTKLQIRAFQQRKKFTLTAKNRQARNLPTNVSNLDLPEIYYMEIQILTAQYILKFLEATPENFNQVQEANEAVHSKILSTVDKGLKAQKKWVTVFNRDLGSTTLDTPEETVNYLRGFLKSAKIFEQIFNNQFKIATILAEWGNRYPQLIPHQIFWIKSQI